jgi:hypothetical protein
MCLSCVGHEPRQYCDPNSGTGRTTAARAMCDAGPGLPTKQELRGALSAETDSEDRNTLTNPLTLADRQTWVVARAPRDLLLLAVSPCAGPCARSEFASSASAG